LFGFLLGYTGILFFVSPRLSLWLDEIRDLIGVRAGSIAALLQYTARKTAAGVPLGYAVQFLCGRMFGLSTFTGRLSSVLFSVAACVGLAVLGLRLKIRHPLLPLLIFASFPLQLRYALEARPYSQALCLSIWCTIAFLRLVERPRLLRAALYCLLVAGGLYTQPYSVFVALAHLCWIILAGNIIERRRVFVLTCVAIAVAACAFLPWLMFAKEYWLKTSVSEEDQFRFTLKSPLMIMKELVGAGYIGTAITLMASALGLGSPTLDRDQKLFWSLCLAAPVVGAVVADASFNYFLASRQMIFVLAPLALLASLGIDSLKTAGARAQVLLFAALLAVNVTADFQFFHRSREDWQPASNRLSAEVARGACVLFVPDHTAEIYAYFHPELEHRACEGNNADIAAEEVAVAVSHYRSAPAYADTSRLLASEGFVKVDEQAGDPRVEIYRRGR
jgi:uncharacterized membrane protein